MFRLFPFILLLILSTRLFSQETVDNEIFKYINSIRKHEKSTELKYDSCLRNASKDYALFIREYYNNSDFKNLKKGVKKMFLETEDVYLDIVNNYVRHVSENLNQFYVFIASKNRFYSEGEMYNIIISAIAAEKNTNYNIFYEDYENIGISCIWVRTLNHEQIIICIISCQ
jgi:hypothetical protein